MKYVALLSGGKDSCFNLLHCSINGHQLIAAASVGPGRGKEEIDSYLYQTVGQDAIELVARALDVPLYRRVITGDALDRRAEYGSRNPADPNGVRGDETEDLYMLLTTVKSHHPDVQGVSVGAILSNYQRVRVEHVCRRLSLIPLCYLWQRDQGELLSDMIDAGMESIIIKIAGIGLTTKHLGKNLASMRPTLLKLHGLYGSHICGEGGEYETLTLDCPLFRQRIKLIEVEAVIHSDNDFATVAYLRIKSAVLEPKYNFSPLQIPIFPLLESNFVTVRDAVEESKHSQQSFQNYKPKSSIPRNKTSLLNLNLTSKRQGRWVAVANVHRDLSTTSDISIEAEVLECFQKLADALSKDSLNLSHCVNINAYLSSMDLFACMNAVYTRFFGISPPARACVAVDLPSPIRFQLDCVAYAENKPDDRQTIHVQGLSYWAPANIGPYSQSITVDSRIFVSGQIGMIPSSLELPQPRSLALETALAFQHVKRIKDVLNGSIDRRWNGTTQSVIYWLIDTQDVVHIRRAQTAHEECSIPTLFLVVMALPKNAILEKQVLLHTRRCFAHVEDDDDDERLLELDDPRFEQAEFVHETCTVYWEFSHFKRSEAFCSIVCIRGEACDSSFRQIRSRCERLRTRSLAIRLFYNPMRLTSFSAIIAALFDSEECPPFTPVPCRFISTSNHDDWDAALYILGD